MLGGKIGKVKKKTTTEIICDNLGLAYQTIFQDYKCTLRHNFSYFGRLYVGQEHLMFVSNMFGIVKKIAIVIDSISKLTQNSVESITITGRHHKSTQEEDYYFSGLKNQNAFKIIQALWKKERLSSDVLNSNDQELEQLENVPGGRSLDEASMEINLFNPQKVETEKQKMFEIVLPCSVQQFYSFFLADDANVYSRKKHLQAKKATLIVVTPWKQNEQMNAEVREVTALLKVKGVPFKSEAPMSQVWLLSKRTPEEINLKIITQMAEVPYSAYFHVEQHITMTKEGQAKCKFVCLTGIVFNKATYMKGTILTKTFEDLQLDYKLWSDNVKELLDRMREQDKEGKPEKKKPSIDVEFEAQRPEPDITSPIKEIPRERRESEDGDITALRAKVETLTKFVKILVGLVSFNLFLNLYQSFGR